MKAKLIKIHDQFYLYNREDDFIASTENNPYQRLSMKNCQAIERGYDLDELAETEAIKISETEIRDEKLERIYKRGFQKAVELMGDKKFSEEDFKLFARKYYREVRNNVSNLLYDQLADKCLKEHIQSLQQTEWDVEIEMEEVAIGDKYTPEPKPKLNAENCLILKRVI